MTDQKAHRRRQGLPLGGPRAFGWENSIIPRESEAQIIREAIEDFLAGASLNEIARRWNAHGVPQPQTGESHWTADIVYRVISNPRHVGLSARTSDRDGRSLYVAEVVGQAQWPPIVDRGKWEMAQTLLHDRGSRNHTPKRRSLLTGLLICSHCLGPMRRSGSGSRKVWRCPSGAVTIDATGVEELLVAATIERIDSPELASLVRQTGAAIPGVALLLTEEVAIDSKIVEVEVSLAKTDGSGLPLEAGSESYTA